jgi:hypothetical protein
VGNTVHGAGEARHLHPAVPGRVDVGLTAYHTVGGIPIAVGPKAYPAVGAGLTAEGAGLTAEGLKAYPAEGPAGYSVLAVGLSRESSPSSLQ